MTEDEILAFSLYAGRQLDAAQYTALQDAGGASCARARAVRILAQRALSRQELIHRLCEKGESQAHAIAAADRLEQLGLLNDLEYGRSIVRHYQARGYGAQKIRFELSRRGIARSLWDELAEENATDPGAQIIQFLSSKRSLDLTDQKERTRAANALLRRGFRWDEIHTAMHEMGARTEEESV